SSRTNAIVVATACLPEPLRSPSQAESGGCGSDLARPSRRACTPPCAPPPCRAHWSSSESWARWRCGGSWPAGTGPGVGRRPRVAAEEVLPDVRAGLHAVGLELAVRRGVHLVDQHAVGVLGQQRVPVAAPDDLDHVPACTAEERLELLDDLAVAAHRAVQALQVAVDDEGEV